MVCPLLKVINPLSRLLARDFTYQREIGSNSHSVSGLCWHGREQPSVCFSFQTTWVSSCRTRSSSTLDGSVRSQSTLLPGSRSAQAGCFSPSSALRGGTFSRVSSSLEGVFFLIAVIQRPGYSGSVLSGHGSLLASLRGCMVLS